MGHSLEPGEKLTEGGVETIEGRSGGADMNRNNVAWVLLADGLFNLFALAEAAYCLPSRFGRSNRRVA